MSHVKPCLKCGKPGIERYTEILPDKAALVQVIHNDGSQPCEFEEYSSISTFLKSRTRTKDPKIMPCPVCGGEGRVATYRPNKNKKFHTWMYYMVHEEIPGYWGKTRIKKHRRCWIRKEEHRNQILKSLGRSTSI